MAPATDNDFCNVSSNDAGSDVDQCGHRHHRHHSKQQQQQQQLGCGRGHWRPAEDTMLRELVSIYGPQNWNLIAERLHGRSGKSCRLRWFNQLDPRINRTAFTEEEEEKLLAAHRIYGNKWANIARLFSGRTDNAVKNHWHVIMARKYRDHQYSSSSAAAAANFRRRMISTSDNSDDSNSRCFSHHGLYHSPAPLMIALQQQQQQLQMQQQDHQSQSQMISANESPSEASVSPSFIDFLGVGAT